MPHITTAMEWSRRRGLGEIMLDSFIRRRSVSEEISNVKDSFSSWSNCMATTYCKWPVIAAIIVGSLIVLSVVWCIVRCACCGMSCCCSCFSCLKCCQCCAPCCEGKRDKSHQKLHDEPYFAPNQGYRAPEPMMGGGLGVRPQPPQYASFEVGKNGFAVDPKPTLSDDALPPMPSWETANKVRVLEEEKNAVELGELDPATGQKMPLMTGGASTLSPSPALDQGNSPYGPRPGQGGYMGVVGNSYGQSQNNLGGYGVSPNPGMANDPLLGYSGTPSPGAASMGYRGSPSPGPVGEQGMGYRGPPAGRGYGGPSPGPNHGPYRGTPSPGPGRGGYAGQQDTFDRPMPQQFSSNDGFHDTPTTGYGQAEPMYDNRPYPSQPSRTYSPNPMNPARQYSNQTYLSHEPGNTYPPTRDPSRTPGGPGGMISPAPANNGGFAAYSSRSPPPQDGAFKQGQYNTPASMTRNPPPQEPAYPGYKSYTPASR